MWENFIDSINVVLPMFLLMVFGYILRLLKFLPESFYQNAEKFVFKVALPCQLFMNIAFADNGGSSADYFKTTVFCAVATVCAFLLGLAVVPLIVKDNGARGAVIQNCFRSNLVVLGIPLIENVAGSAGKTLFSLTIPATIVITNVLSVIELNLFAPSEHKRSAKELAVSTLRSVVTNPLIIATVLGLPFLIFGIEIPESMSFVHTTLNCVSSTTQALALISLGAGFSFVALKGKLQFSLPTAIYKIAILPLIIVPIAHYLFGFTGTPLAIVFIIFATPSAVSSYIMAKNMKSDAECASQILLLSTMLCSFTLFTGFFVLKTLGWI